MNKSFIKILFYFAVISFVFSLDSCVSRKEIVYFQDQGRDTTISTDKMYDIIFRPGDIVTIVVSAMDIEAARPFNMPVVGFNAADGRVSGIQRLQDYLINNKGIINFPILGNIHLGGLTRDEATKLLVKKLTKYIKNPIVNIRLTNFKITVLGEVKKPGTYVINNERVSLPEALGMAGDLTISGKRDNVLVIREINGVKSKVRIDLTKDDIFTSPVYYLAQNDVIYVEPKKSKIQDSTFGKSTSVAFSLASIVIQLALFVWQVRK